MSLIEPIEELFEGTEYSNENVNSWFESFVTEELKQNILLSHLNASDFISCVKSKVSSNSWDNFFPKKYADLLKIFLHKKIEINHIIVDSEVDLIIVFRLFKTITFDACTFNIPLDMSFRSRTEYNFLWSIGNNGLKMNGSKIFQRCVFKNEVFIPCVPKSYDSSEANRLFDNDVFLSCIFQEAVIVEALNSYLKSVAGSNLNNSNYDVEKLFSRCEFQKCLTLEKLIIFKDLASFFKENFPKTLNIESCIFKGLFELNNLKEVELIRIKDSEFHEKFEFKGSGCKVFKIGNTSFKKDSYFLKSDLKKFQIISSTFEEFAVFEDCNFGEESFDSEMRMNITATVFKYTTFKNFSNFRGSKFYTGLDIEKASFAQPPNFLDAYVPSENTPRETFRLIKHSFDSVGSYIEANKFFSLEMKKLREELSAKRGNRSSRFLLAVNDCFSSFGQSYLWPLFFLLATAGLFQGYTYLHNIDWLISNLPKVNEALLPITNFVNSFAQFVMPFNKLLVTGMEFASLIFTVLSSVFLWHFIIAVKRQVKR